MFGKVSKKAMAFGAIATMTAGLMAGCGTSNNAGQGGTTSGGTTNQASTVSGKITAAGSTALLPLVKQAATDFQNANPNVTVDVSGGGSGTGLSQVAQGAIDIGDSDVPAGSQYPGLVDHQVCVAPFILITNKDVGIKNLTKDQAGKIFTGQITNWKEVGGKDEKITVISRAASSGSRKYITSAVLPAGSDFEKNAIIQDSTGSLKQAVAQTAGAIGYLDAAYGDDTINILQYDGETYSPANVENGTYKLYTYEHMFTKGQPNAQAKAFLDFIMSSDFQDKYVEAMKFIPVSKMQVK